MTDEDLKSKEIISNVTGNIQEISNIFNIQNMRLIVGLGNVGKLYDTTRHNAGFIFIDLLAQRFRINFVEERKMLCHLGEHKTEIYRYFLSKPTTMMNESGKSVRMLANFYKIKPEEILIVHDDLDITLGKSLLQFGKGPKVHNGLTSIQNSLGTSKFWRLRVGVDSRDSDQRKLISGADYVLGKMNAPDMDVLLNNLELQINSFFI